MAHDANWTCTACGFRGPLVGKSEQGEARCLGSCGGVYGNPATGAKGHGDKMRQGFDLGRPDEQVISVRDRDREVVRISHDGKVTLGEGVTPEHAAHEFWRALMSIDKAGEVARLTSELAEARAVGSIVAADGETYTLQERYDVNAAILKARTRVMNEYLERATAAEARVKEVEAAAHDAHHALMGEPDVAAAIAALDAVTKPDGKVRCGRCGDVDRVKEVEAALAAVEKNHDGVVELLGAANCSLTEQLTRLGGIEAAARAYLTASRGVLMHRDDCVDEHRDAEAALRAALEVK